MSKEMRILEIDWANGISVTTYGHGPYHPAIRNGRKIWYWPNITMVTEEAAYKHACETLNSALEEANEVINGWNIWEV